MAGRENELTNLIRKIDTLSELKIALQEIERLVYYIAEENGSCLEGKELAYAMDNINILVHVENVSDVITDFAKLLEVQ